MSGGGCSRDGTKEGRRFKKGRKPLPSVCVEESGEQRRSEEKRRRIQTRWKWHERKEALCVAAVEE